MKKEALSTTLAGLFVVFLFSCNSGGGGNNGDSIEQVRLSGTIGSGYTIAKAKQTELFARFFSLVTDAYAQTVGATVDKILAVSFNQHDLVVSEATINNNTFSVSVDKNYPQLLVFLNGTTTIGVYKVDSATDLDAFPLKDLLSTNIDLGTVSYDPGTKKMTGTLINATLLTTLGIDQGLATSFGLIDNGLMRLSSLDVDGNGVLDYSENRNFNFTPAYSFSSSETPTEMNGAFALPQAVVPAGYTYMYGDNGPYSSGTNSGLLNWGLATLTTPTAIDGKAVWPVCSDPVNCYNAAEGGAGLNFVDPTLGLPSPLFTNPSTPPSGTYVISIPQSSGTGTQTFTFNDVQTRAIDTNMYDVYVPSLKLNMDGSNHVSLIEWQWWKRQSSDGTWVQPTDAELAMVLSQNGYHLCSKNFGTECVNGTINFTSTGSVVPPAQSFALYDVMVWYHEISGYSYSFDWR